MSKVLNTFVFLSIMFLGFSFSAGNTVKINSLDLTSTFNCLGVIAQYEGDNNLNAAAKVFYRAKGVSKWQEGYPLFRITEKRFAGSLFSLKPGTIYEVIVKLEDVDGLSGAGTASSEIKTRVDAVPVPSGKIIIITPSDDVKRVIAGLKPGDTVIFKKGVYYLNIDIALSGKSTEPIVLKSETAGEAVLDGSNPGIVPQWNLDEKTKTFWASCDEEPLYIASGEEQLYRYAKFDDLNTNPAKANGFWHYDEKENKLFCKYDRKTKLNISFAKTIISLEKADNIVIDGFSLRYARTGVLLSASSGNWIRNNIIRNCGGGIEVYKDTSCNNIVENNQITDTSITSWEWKFVKATYFERCGIGFSGGSGNVVRHNKINGLFNGIAPAVWNELYEENYNSNMDVYGNEIFDIGDDGWEPEGCCINTRFFENKIYKVWHPFSLAPITVGPTYVIKNIVYDFHGGSGAFKFNVGINKAEGNMLIVHNTCFTDATGVNALTLGGNIPPANIVFRNNILSGSRYAIEDSTKAVGDQFDLDYDLWYKMPEADRPVIKWKNDRYKTFEEWQDKFKKEIHGMLKEAMFTDPAKGDFTLKSESPAVDAGVILPGINEDFKGNAPDLGAIELK